MSDEKDEVMEPKRSVHVLNARVMNQPDDPPLEQKNKNNENNK